MKKILLSLLFVSAMLLPSTPAMAGRFRERVTVVNNGYYGPAYYRTRAYGYYGYPVYGARPFRYGYVAPYTYSPNYYSPYYASGAFYGPYPMSY